MINYIEFEDERFEHEDDYNVIDNVTKDCIILCSSSEIKDIISDQIEKSNEKDGPIYTTILDEEADINTIVRYLPTSIYRIDKVQQIIVTVEDPYVLQSKTPDDLWFADINNDERIEIYPFKAFNGWQRIWDAGVFNVYKDTIMGRFGAFGKYGR